MTCIFHESIFPYRDSYNSFDVSPNDQNFLALPQPYHDNNYIDFSPQNLSYPINLLYLLSHHFHHNIPENELAFENHLLISMTINAIKPIVFLSPFRLLPVKVIFLLILMTYPNIFLTINYPHLIKLFQLPFLYKQNLNFFMKL